jgi:hypothetical protein
VPVEGERGSASDGQMGGTPSLTRPVMEGALPPFYVKCSCFANSASLSLWVRRRSSLQTRHLKVEIVINQDPFLTVKWPQRLH